MESLPLVGSQIEDVRLFVEGLTSTEGRIVASATVLFVTLVLVGVLAPYVIRKLGPAIRRRLLTEQATRAVDVVTDYIPTTFGTLFLVLVQLGLLFVAAVTLLTLWGLADVAVTVVRFVGSSVPHLATFVVTVGLLLAGYIVADLFDGLVTEYSNSADRVTAHQQEIILRVGHVGILAFVVTGVLTLWGIDLSGLLVGAGFLGIVVGLAARQTLGSMIAGFVLMFSRPFTLGDWVEVGDQEGIVTDITIMNTRLLNFDGESIVIPNDTVSNQAITNRSEQGHLRIRLDVGIDYETDPERAEEIAHETITGLDSVVDTPPPQVVPKSFGDSAIILELRFWIDRPTPQHRWQAIQAVIHAVKAAFDSEGIKIPYPQRELSGRAETDGFQVAGSAPNTESRHEPDPVPEE